MDEHRKKGLRVTFTELCGISDDRVMEVNKKITLGGSSSGLGL